MRIVPFESTHCEGTTAHPSQAEHQHLLDAPQYFKNLWGETYSALDGDDLIAIGGVLSSLDIVSGWVLFTDKITPARFVAVHKAVVRGLAYIHEPVMVHVDPDRSQAVRWATMLGMNGRQMEMMPDGREMARMTTHARVL